MRDQILHISSDESGKLQNGIMPRNGRAERGVSLPLFKTALSF
jgi:hypothetical protein